MRLLAAIPSAPLVLGGGHDLALLAQLGPSGPLAGPMGLFMVIFFVIFIVILLSFFFRLAMGAAEWTDNNRQPVLTVPARVVTKRTAVSVYSRAGNVGENWPARSSTSYFTTFEFATGERREFRLGASEYGLLAEQDRGELSCQGTRYLGFNRDRNRPLAGESRPAVEPPPVANGDGFCPACGAPVRQGFKYCPGCGQPVPEFQSQS